MCLFLNYYQYELTDNLSQWLKEGKPVFIKPETVSEDNLGFSRLTVPLKTNAHTERKKKDKSTYFPSGR